MTGIDAGRAGRSAQREHDRRVARRRQRVLRRHPVAGWLWLAAAGDPATTRSWAAGAAGERVVGARLDRLLRRGVVTLHDRRPPGSRGNLDHVAVGPAGVFVVDAKQLHGARVAVRRTAGWFMTMPPRLRIGGRDRTAMVDGMAWQVDAVRRALAPLDGAVPVRPVLALVGGHWPPAAGVLRVGHVQVARPHRLGRVVGRQGPLAPDEVRRIAAHLAEALPPA